MVYVVLIMTETISTIQSKQQEVRARKIIGNKTRSLYYVPLAKQLGSKSHRRAKPQSATVAIHHFDWQSPLVAERFVSKWTDVAQSRWGRQSLVDKRNTRAANNWPQPPAAIHGAYSVTLLECLPHLARAYRQATRAQESSWLVFGVVVDNDDDDDGCCGSLAPVSMCRVYLIGGQLYFL